MSKSKGNGGEREVARLLADWWPERELDDGRRVVFVRTPLSGGWAYGAEFKTKGDITTNAPRFPFCVEVKRHEGWSLARLLKSKPSPVWKFWRQCQRDARVAKAEPMLWVRQNRKPWLVMVRARAVKLAGLPAPQVTFADNLARLVDCQAQPVMYLGEELLRVNATQVMERLYTCLG